MMSPTALRAHSDDLRRWSMTALYAILSEACSLARASAA